MINSEKLQTIEKMKKKNNKKAYVSYLVKLSGQDYVGCAALHKYTGL